MKLPNVVPFLIDYGVDVLVTVLDQATGVLMASLGDAASNTPDSQNAEWWQQVGFASRPAAPTQGGSACQGIVLRRSDRDMIIATRDVRGTAIYGNLAAGEACMYAPGSQARLMLKADGSVSRQTTDTNADQGNTIFDRVSPYFQTPSGPMLGGSWQVYAPWGSQWMDPTGWHLRIWQPGPPNPSGAPATGVQMDFGPNPLPALPGLTPLSQGAISVDYLTIDAATLQLGRDNGTAQALVQAAALQAVMGLVATALTNIAASLVTLGQPAAGVAAAVAALGTITSACATKAVTAT